MGLAVKQATDNMYQLTTRFKSHSTVRRLTFDAIAHVNTSAAGALAATDIANPVARARVRACVSVAFRRVHVSLNN